MGKVDDVLAEMRRERERLTAELAQVDRVIEALEARSPAAATASAALQASQASGPGPYYLLDLYQATLQYLSTVDSPQSATEIAAALRAGGFKTRSKDFANTVRVMLRRVDGRTSGISITNDGNRWFVRRKR